MARKRQKTQQHEVKTSASLSPQLRDPDIKISEAILALCEPLRNQYRDRDRIQTIISITVMAWNISLFQEEERIHVQRMLLASLPEQFSGEDVGALLECIATLIERKHRYYPSVREYILKHQLSFSGDTITLTVGTAEVPDKIQRRIS